MVAYSSGVTEPIASGPTASASPLEHVSLPSSVHRVLRRRILNNELGAGTRLVEANLALELGVSRTTVREALRQLAQEGLVEIFPRRHSVVTRMRWPRNCTSSSARRPGSCRRVERRCGFQRRSMRGSARSWDTSSAMVTSAA